MICPQCHAEYRQGYTSCADCHVLLVNELREPEPEAPEGAEAGHENEVPPGVQPRMAAGEFPIELWSGEDLELLSRLREALDREGIPHYNWPTNESPEVRRPSNFLIAERPQFGFTLAVSSNDWKAAAEVLEKVLDEEPEGIELPASADENDAPQEAARDGDGEATLEIWSGADVALCGFLEAALDENGIAARGEATSHGNRLFVKPRDEARAREVVREIVEGAPPQ